MTTLVLQSVVCVAVSIDPEVPFFGSGVCLLLSENTVHVLYVIHYRSHQRQRRVHTILYCMILDRRV